MTKDEALKMTLEALEGIRRYGLDTLSGRIDGPDDREWQRAGVNEMTKQARLAITAIKEHKDAYAQPEQEPVAWGVFEGNLHDMFFSPSEAQEMADLKGTHAEVRPLYTTPPQRKPLTDEEMKKIWYAMQNIVGWYSFQEIARAIEAAHGIKE